MNSQLQSLLSIAGFDPTSGAGITQDLLAFRAYGFHPLAVPAVLVAEDSRRATGRFPTSAVALKQMLELLKGDFEIVGVKLGLLPSDPAALEVIGEFLFELSNRKLEQRPVSVVFDPVMSTSGGDKLVDPAILPILKNKILPFVDLLTPNLNEFCAWIGHVQSNDKDVEWAMRYGMEFVAQYGSPLLLTGLVETLDDAYSSQIIDLFFEADECQLFASSRFDVDPHGTGCLHSCLLLVALSRGKTLREAATWAKAEMQRHFGTLRYPAKSRRPFLPVGLLS
jgi:hydroxymethylpyrimidine/phosphomethylpyrimidine kinase